MTTVNNNEIRTNTLKDSTGVTNITLASSGLPSFPNGINGFPTQITVTTKTANYTILDGDGFRTILCDSTSGAFTVTLPAVATNTNRVITFKKTDSSTNTVTIARAGSATIDGATNNWLNRQYDEFTVICDGTNWHVVDAYFPARLETDSTASFGTITAATVATVLTLTVPPGTWEFQANAQIQHTGATGTAIIYYTNNNNAAPSVVTAYNTFDLQDVADTAADRQVGFIVPIREAFTASTTRYFAIRADTTNISGVSRRSFVGRRIS